MAGAESPDDTVRNGSALKFDGLHRACGDLLPLFNRRGYFLRLTISNPDAPVAITDYDERSEAESPSTTYDRRAAVNLDDIFVDRSLCRLTRAGMTDTEYQTFRGKLAMRQSAYLIDFSTGSPQPPATNVLLKDGDIVEVERIELAVRVDGLVLRPGFIAYEENKKIGDYIRMAGGTTEGADGGSIRLTRIGSNESQRAQSGTSVGPGDFIWVPEKKETSFWGTFKDVITVVGQAATIIILVDTLNDGR